MTCLKVPFISGETQDMDTALELGGARFDVCCVNWPETFPYAPFCSGRIARTQDALVVDFRVSGLDLRARNTEDNLRQWEDSCVEVFIKDPVKADYYNFEMNALGKVLACYGPVREGRTRRPESEMKQILRCAQNDMMLDASCQNHFMTGGLSPQTPWVALLQNKDLEGIQSWRVGIAIPFGLIGLDPGNLPHSIRANFYKCGDKTAHPHYLSWSPIDTPRPDFHRPDFFGELLLD